MIEPMPQPRARELAEALYPPPLWMRAIRLACVLGCPLLLGYALGQWRAAALYDPPAIGFPLVPSLPTEYGETPSLLVRFLHAAPEVSRDGGQTWRECR